jgi:hypothetical protein
MLNRQRASRARRSRRGRNDVAGFSDRYGLLLAAGARRLWRRAARVGRARSCCRALPARVADLTACVSSVDGRSAVFAAERAVVRPGAILDLACGVVDETARADGLANLREMASVARLRASIFRASTLAGSAFGRLVSTFCLSGRAASFAGPLSASLAFRIASKSSAI